MQIRELAEGFNRYNFSVRELYRFIGLFSGQLNQIYWTVVIL